MWLNDLGFDDSWINSWEGAKENSSEDNEKYSEQSKRSWDWVKRVKKDKRKAKKYDCILAYFLVEILKNKKYDFLFSDLFLCLDYWFNSNFIIWILSLIYLPISDKIRLLAEKEEIDFKYVKTFSKIEFSENLDSEIKNRLNYWIEDIIDIISIEYSSILIRRILWLSQTKEYYQLLNFTSKVFIFFFSEININIDEKTAISYSNYILDQIFTKIKKIKLEEI